MDLHYALYQSRASIDATPEQHNDILQTSQRNNSRHGITGFLLHEGCSFIQYLEGPKTGVFTTLARIGRDPRHTDFDIIKIGPTPEKLMPDWPMAFVHTDQPSFEALRNDHKGRIDLKIGDPLEFVAMLSANAHVLHNRHLQA
ncbi:MAG: BLUF domain-containing protein [Roseobacter sp.]